MSQTAMRKVPQEGLATRIGPVHLRQRLAIEREGEAPVFGRGRTAFHPENTLSFASVLRGALKLVGLYRRGQRNAQNIAVVENRVPIAGLATALRGLRILQIADLHVDAHPDFANVLARRLQGLDYDLCVLTGDYRFLTSGSFEPAMRGLATVRAALRHPVYAILGNHDSIHMVPAIEAMDIRLLLNESVTIRRGAATLHLAGVDDPHFFRTDNLEKTAHDIPAEASSILLSHSPELFRQAASCGFDVMLAGHTHGGQLRLPGGVALFTNADCPRSFAAGAWRYGELYGYTSLGAGSSILDVRFNCQPEVVIHTLTGGT